MTFNQSDSFRDWEELNKSVNETNEEPAITPKPVAAPLYPDVKEVETEVDSESPISNFPPALLSSVYFEVCTPKE